MPKTIKIISPADLHELLQSDREHALVDVREIDTFSHQHLLFAVPIPYGRLELLIADLLPVKSISIVVCDDGEGLAKKTAQRLNTLGYANLSILDGGVSGWAEAGYETYSGVNVPSKAFGEFIEHEEHTPSLSATEVHTMMENKEDMVILDSRPFLEFNWASIPSGQCCSGAELVYRAFSNVPSPETTVIVNCAGRTRSIIGAQSLINAGLPNKVYALRNGIMGWRLSGFKPSSGEQTWASPPHEHGLTQSIAASDRVAERFKVQQVSTGELAQWRAERSSQSLFVLDVRTDEEYEAGHLGDAVHAPGGQVIQATDEYIGVRNSRIILVDNDGVRASMTASWLNQMGQKNVRTLFMDDIAETLTLGPRDAPVVGLSNVTSSNLNVEDVLKKQQDGAITLDLSLSTSYRAGHIPSAWFILRSQLVESFKALPEATAYILTSDDGKLAKLCFADIQSLVNKPVYCLKGGNAAWLKDGQKLVNGDEKFSVEPIDVWRIPFAANKAKGETVEDAMRAYLDWEVDLMAQLGRDGTTKFKHYSNEAHD